MVINYYGQALMIEAINHRYTIKPLEDNSYYILQEIFIHNNEQFKF